MSQSNVWLGLVNPKTPENVGNILRAAGCFNVQGIFYTGNRYHHARKFISDTKDNHERIPLVHCETLQQMLPESAVPVAVELVEGATPLMHFEHPQNAFYIFGPEDGSLSKDLVAWCKQVVYIPTTGCLNLSATVNVVLYDRMSKSADIDLSLDLIRASRDNNNRLKVK
ncbi:MAG TPA: RNA methyltransferase [Pseudomonadales bacterium]|nr:RNA methyltransferase [Pseudomonadales bacterium]